MVTKNGLATAITKFYVPHTAEVRYVWYNIFQRSIALSTVVAPVAIHWGSQFTRSLGGGSAYNL